ncbi:unnamed protein product, partial [Allacma fusca]
AETQFLVFARVKVKIRSVEQEE